MTGPASEDGRGTRLLTVFFEGADDLADALNVLNVEAAEHNASAVAIESSTGFALNGYASLIEISEGDFTINLTDKEPSP